MRSNMRMFTATLTAILLAGCAFAQDWNVSVKTDTNGALRVPLAAPFRATNDIASASSMNASNTADRAYALGLVTNASIASSNYTDTIAGGKASTNEMNAVVATNAAQDISIASSLTNGVGSGCTVTTTGKTLYVYVVAPTGTAASVDADLQDHKTNATAHAALFAAIPADDLSWTTNRASASNLTGFVTAPATWNADFNTIDIAMPDGVTGQMFQENHVPVKNVSGATISNGAVVYLQNSPGFYASAWLASSTNGFDKCFSTLGFATHDITNNGIGKITTFGNVNELNTVGHLEGTNIWLATTPGTYQDYMPTNSTECKVALGMVLREHANQGRIYVRVQFLPSADDVGALQSEADTPSSVFERSLVRTNATPLSLPGGDGFYISEIFPSVTWGPAWIFNGITNLLSLGGGGNDRALFIFYDTGGGAQVFDTENPPTAEQSGAVSINDATYTQTVALAGSALQSEADTLQTVVNRSGGTGATNIPALDGGTWAIGANGRMVRGYGVSLTNIAVDAYGAQQSGYNFDSQTIGSAAVGAKQAGLNSGSQVIGADAYGAEQIGSNSGTQTIGDSAYGAQQRGAVSSGAAATNNAHGAMQLLSLNAGQTATTTPGGSGSILLGAGTASNRYSIVAGDGQTSHGDGSITAGGGFYGSGSNLTGITAAQVGAVSTNGGTVNGSLLTTVDQLATAPTSDEFVTAGWARNVMSSGKAVYMTTNLFNAQWGPTNTTGIGSYDNGDQQWANFAVTGVNHYVASMIDTNPIPANTPLVGPATVHIHLGLDSGSPAANYGFSAKPELYYTYDLAATSLTLGDFEADPQAWTAGSTNGRTFILSWPSVTPTNTYYRAFRLKCTAKGSATTNVVMGVGGTDSSFVQLQQSTADYELTGAKIVAAGGLTNITAAQIVDAGGLTNVTPAAIVAAGAVTGTPWTASVLASNLLALVANGTCSVPYRADAPATDQQFYMAQTQATVLAMGTFSTNSAWSIPLSLNTMGYQLTYCACSFRTNTGTMRTNAWNMLVLSRPAFETNWTATVLP